jgi:hypothetical protein
MYVGVVYVETCAILDGAITISMASTCGNKDFWSEFLDIYISLLVLWHIKSVLYQKKKKKKNIYIYIYIG